MSFMNKGFRENKNKEQKKFNKEMRGQFQVMELLYYLALELAPKYHIRTITELNKALEIEGYHDVDDTGKKLILNQLKRIYDGHNF